MLYIIIILGSILVEVEISQKSDKNAPDFCDYSISENI